MNGNKSALIKRLMDALDKNVTFVENETNEIRYSLTGDTFNGSANLTMIDKDGYVIEEENRYLIEGCRIFDPTVPHNNYWGVTDGVGPSNMN